MSAHSTLLPGRFSGLSFKLITTIITVILAVEVIIYLPSVANYRANWLAERLHVAAVAAKVVDTVPADMDLPPELTDNLLKSAGAFAIVIREPGQSRLFELTGWPMPAAAVTADMSRRDPASMILGALEVLFQGSDRIMRIVGPNPDAGQGSLEVIMSEEPLRDGMLTYSRNIFYLSLLVAILTAGAIFLFVNRTIIVPLRRLIGSMANYRRAPENASLIISTRPRADEIGVAERELAAMEGDLFVMLRQRRHLADLGLAVAKINHDLRNILTSAQLLSDQVAVLDDPKVQRLAPRLVTTLDKAIGFAQSVIDYGRQSNTPPKPQPVDLRALVEECCFDAGLAGHPDISFSNSIPDQMVLLVDPDQMARVFVNVLKNSREALEEHAGTLQSPPQINVDAVIGPDEIVIGIEDNGPGLPPRARDNLFVAFEGSGRAAGTGLGLAIARELVVAHGGQLAYVDDHAGARFEIRLPYSVRAM